MRKYLIPLVLTLTVGVLVGAGCDRPGAAEEETTLRLATTTSTDDSGLLDSILPDFESEFDAGVDVIAVGTGQALELGRRGDVDAVLVHAPEQERQFVDSGYGINRQHVMTSDFVIAGPEEDPAQIKRAGTAVEAFTFIAGTEATFASRGDQSGTHIKEQGIWREAAIRPNQGDAGWYQVLGQGMGETLVAANELKAYVLTDRPTFLTMRDDLSQLTILFGGETIRENPDPMLLNPYGVIQVNPERRPSVNEELAAQFVTWITSPETQQQIAEFGREEFDQPLFLPASATP